MLYYPYESNNHYYNFGSDRGCDIAVSKTGVFGGVGDEANSEKDEYKREVMTLFAVAGARVRNDDVQALLSAPTPRPRVFDRARGGKIDQTSR